MLDPNPKTRISINECFKHAFFKPEKREIIEADFANIEESSILTEVHLKHLYFSFPFFLIFFFLGGGTFLSNVLLYFVKY